MKRIIILCFISAISIRGYSQIELGLTGGLNLSKYTFDYANMESPTSDFKLGYHVGVVSRVFLSEKIDFEPGIVYSSKGFSGDNGSDLEFRVNYLEIPLIISYSLNESLYGFAGPYISMGVSGKYKFSAGGDVYENDIEFAYKEVNYSAAFTTNYVERVDYGANIGLGYSVNESFTFRMIYSLGLNNTNVDIVDDNHPSYPDSQPYSADNRKAFNRVISFSTTYFFSL